MFTLALAISYVQELQEYVQPATCFSAIMPALGVAYMIANAEYTENIKEFLCGLRGEFNL